MAIIKTIPIHDVKGIRNAVDYIKDETKTSVDINDLLSYTENIKKTAFELDGDENILVSGFNCGVDSAPEEFMSLKINYEDSLRARGIEPESLIYGKKAGKGKYEGELVDKEAREAYHIIMSFPKRADLSPQMVHHIGLEFCEKAFPDTKAVVSTHMNTDNLHNHIVRSAYNISTVTKYRDTVENLEELRRINDEISLKYGLEIILERNTKDKQGHSWLETMEREKGESWKEILKADIRKSIELANSWTDYKNKMTQAGYVVTEKGKTVVYSFLNDKNRCVRENKLGTDYSREHIYELFNEDIKENEYVIRASKSENGKNSPKKIALKAKDVLLEQHSAAAGHHKKMNLFVSRYTLQGRRRSDLELIFLAAIKIINYYKDTNADSKQAREFPDNPVYQPYYLKLKTMRASLNMTIGHDIKDEKHLTELKHNAGAKMSVKETELKSIELNLKKSNELAEMISDYEILKGMLKTRGLDDIDLRVIDFSEKDIRDNYAKFNPMTALQRRELYKKLSSSTHRVTVKYDSISYKDCQAIFDYIDGKTDVRPDILISEDEYLLHPSNKYENRHDTKKYDSPDDIKRKNFEFENSISSLSSDDQGLLYRFRVILNDLASRGYKEDSFIDIKLQNEEIAKLYNQVKKEAADARWEYRNYSRLEWNMNLAKNEPYTKGVNIVNGAKDKSVVLESEHESEVAIDENINTDLSKEDDAIVDDSLSSKNKKYDIHNDLFPGIGDGYI